MLSRIFDMFIIVTIFLYFFFFKIGFEMKRCVYI